MWPSGRYSDISGHSRSDVALVAPPAKAFRVPLSGTDIRERCPPRVELDPKNCACELSRLMFYMLGPLSSKRGDLE